MQILQAIALGLVQGVTEFLPISSSAHLILTSHWLGWRDQGLSFDMAVHFGSLVAVILFFRREVAAALRLGSREPDVPGARRLATAVAIGTVPAAVAGLLARPLVATTGREPLLIATTSILFGLLLWWADRRTDGHLGLGDVDARLALVIGCAQALALVPGTSRAGITLTAALFLGFGREAAARFSFLLAIPIGLLVGAWRGLDLLTGNGGGPGGAALAAGFVAAGVSAYLVIGWLLAWVRRQRLTVFVVYRVLLGLLILGIAIA